MTTSSSSSNAPGFATPPETTSWPLVALTGGVVLTLVGLFLAIPKYTVPKYMRK